MVHLLALFVVACVLRPGSSRTRCNLMRGSRERGLNLIVCFVLCHVSADGLVLAGFVLSLPRSCLLAHACAWCQATRLASRRSSCMWWTSSRSRALWSLLGPRFCPFLGITPCRFAPILFLVRLPDLPLPPPSSRFSLVSQTPCSIGFLSAAVFCLLTAL